MSRAVALVLALLMLPAAALGQSRGRLAVVAPSSPPQLGGIAERLAQETVAAARAEGYEVVPPSEVQAALGEQRYGELQRCEGKPGCIAAKAGALLKADRLVAGTLDRNETSYLVRFSLVDLKAPVVLASIDRSVLIASRRLHGDLAAALPRMLRGEDEAKGRLTVETSAPGATLSFDGEEICQTPCGLDGKPGKHAIRVVLDGYLPVERFVTIEAGEEARLSLPLTPTPGLRPRARPAAGVTSGSEPDEGGGTGASLPVTAWVAGGVALAAAGAGAIFGARAGQLQERAGTAAPYQITRAEALDGERDALIANVCFGAAGAAAIAAVLFAVLDDGDAPSSATALLAPAPGGGAVGVAVSF